MLATAPPFALAGYNIPRLSPVRRSFDAQPRSALSSPSTIKFMHASEDLLKDGLVKLMHSGLVLAMHTSEHMLDCPPV
uniref:Uncharacterized protein n=1 Tax=Erpetoichthys calabaricus TaxID=27687 RepID=A0A8C4SIR4_ERPCA